MCRMIREYFERDRLRGRVQAGGRHSQREDGARVAVSDEGGARRPLARARDLFRFGASALLTDIERQLEHFVTGPLRRRAPSADAVAATMATVAEIFPHDGIRPGAGERQGSAAPGSAKHERVFGHFIGGAVDRAAAKTFDVDQPGDGQRHSRRSTQGTTADVDAAVAAARAALPAWKALVAACARAVPLRARARACRSTRACSPCSRRMDNGKSIRETRDIDVPLVARHFYHHAGWAQLLDSEFAGLRGRSASSARSFRGTFRC